MTTEALGIHQSDLIIRTAIIAAIHDLRLNPHLLDYVFASLPADALTANEYGVSQVQKAKDWFLKTNVKVYLNVNMNNVSFPCVSIALANSTEDENTLGDIHYQPFEDTDVTWPILVGPIDPVSYTPETGELELAAADLNGFILVPGLLVVDAVGGQHLIKSVTDDTHITIDAGLNVDLSKLKIMPQRPAQIAAIESASFRETYSLGCHVDSEAVHLTYLHSIVVFALLRYRQSLLEARGLERTNISSSDFRRDDETLPEFLYSRYLQLSGFVRQAWPKAITNKIGGLRVELVVTDADNLQEANITQVNEDIVASLPGITTSTVYYGVAAQPGTIDAAFVLGLASSYRTTVRQATVSYNAGVNQYCWFACPVSFAPDGDDFIDEETVEIAGFSLVGTVLVAGVYVQVWRTNQSDLGPLTVIVT